MITKKRIGYFLIAVILTCIFYFVIHEGILREFSLAMLAALLTVLILWLVIWLITSN